MENLKNTAIALNNYSELLIGIKSKIEKTQNDIIKTITRQKLVMAWQIGKAIDEHLSKNPGSGYGKHLLKKLEQDINIATKNLYKMHNFYQTYQTLPQDDDKLNWSHYRILSGIKKDQERQYLEDLTKEQGWGVHRLQEEVVKSKSNPTNKNEGADNQENLPKNNAQNANQKKAPTKLKPERGQLFSYPLIKLEGVGQSCIDLGFNIFKEVGEDLPKATIIDVIKKKGGYSFAKSETSPHKFNTYKAYLERVVDGDTIRVTIDLGFATFHREIIRLRGIDAPEIGGKEGKKSCKILQSILKNAPFLIIKTSKIDIYGRYVADVYLPTFSGSELLPTSFIGQSDGGLPTATPQQVADEGIYLNQLLLDKGAARLF